MPELEIEGSFEEQFGIMKSTLKEHNAILKGNGREGIVDVVKTTLGFMRGAAWVSGIVGIVLMAILGWALSQIIPAAKVILDDYYSHHPTARMSLSVNPGAQARNPQQQQTTDAFGERYDTGNTAH